MLLQGSYWLIASFLWMLRFRWFLKHRDVNGVSVRNTTWFSYCICMIRERRLRENRYLAASSSWSKCFGIIQMTSSLSRIFSLFYWIVLLAWVRPTETILSWAWSILTWFRSVTLPPIIWQSRLINWSSHRLKVIMIEIVASRSFFSSISR